VSYQPRAPILARASIDMVVRIGVLVAALVNIQRGDSAETWAWICWGMCVLGCLAYSVKRMPGAGALAGMITTAVFVTPLTVLTGTGAALGVCAEVAFVAGLQLPVRRSLAVIGAGVLALVAVVVLTRSAPDAHRHTGLGPTSIRITGPRRPVPPEAGLALYRTVQEALTNARKHAPAAPVTVALDYADADVTATVTNGAPSATPGALAPIGGGHGLVGLRERAELGGGTLTAGPTDNGWHVSVTIPS
jgi:hypothetical protein